MMLNLIRTTKSSSEVVRDWFGSDQELATRYARKIQAVQKHPPAWVSDLLGPKKGWRDPLAHNLR